MTRTPNPVSSESQKIARLSEAGSASTERFVSLILTAAETIGQTPSKH